MPATSLPGYDQYKPCPFWGHAKSVVGTRKNQVLLKKIVFYNFLHISVAVTVDTKSGFRIFKKTLAGMVLSKRDMEVEIRDMLFPENGHQGTCLFQKWQLRPKLKFRFPVVLF